MIIRPVLICLSAIILILSYQPVGAQAPTVDVTRRLVRGVQIDTVSLTPIADKKQKSYFETGISYQNNDVYFGRKDSSSLPYFIPVLSYYHRSGLYISANINYLSTPQASRIDLVSLEAGYIFQSGNYDGQFNISKYIYNAQSSSVSSEIQGSAAWQNGYDFGILKTYLNLNLGFGTQIDYSTSLGLEHQFGFLKDRLSFTPGICVNAGTQNFYDNYYKNKRYSNNGKGHLSGNSGTTMSGSVVNPSNFKILDYEVSIPFSYSISKLVLNFTPTYAMPVNPSLINVNTKHSNGNASNNTVNESLSNTFYMAIGLTLKFG